MLCFTQVIGRGFKVEFDRNGVRLFDVLPVRHFILSGLRVCYKSIIFYRGTLYTAVGARSSVWIGKKGSEPPHLYRVFDFDGSEAKAFFQSVRFDWLVDRFLSDLLTQKTQIQAYIERF